MIFIFLPVLILLLSAVILIIIQLVNGRLAGSKKKESDTLINLVNSKIEEFQKNQKKYDNQDFNQAAFEI